jgi:hypothetical protein
VGDRTFSSSTLERSASRSDLSIPASTRYPLNTILWNDGSVVSWVIVPNNIFST